MNFESMLEICLKECATERAKLDHKEALLKHCMAGGAVEMLTAGGAWVDCDKPSFVCGYDKYRVMIRPLSLHWDVIHPKYNYAVVLTGGAVKQVCLFPDEPKWHNGTWAGVGWHLIGNDVIQPIITTGEYPFKDSMIKRPGV